MAFLRSILFAFILSIAGVQGERLTTLSSSSSSSSLVPFFGHSTTATRTRRTTTTTIPTTATTPTTMTMTSTKIAHDDLRKSKSLRLLSSTTSIPRGGSGSGTYSSLISSAQDSLLIQTGVVHQLLEIIDVLGTFVFAFAGAYKAGKKGMDLLGMMILASITAIGGGTVRDLLMGTGGKAIFWLRNPIYIQISFVTTIATYLLWPIFEREFGIKDSARTICTADAFAMAAFCVLGTKRGVEKNLAPPMWVVSGVITSVFGGIIRDILCGEPPRVMYPYKSMLSAGPILGSVIYTLLTSSKQKFDEDLVSVTAFLVTFSVRTWSFDHPWRLPHWPDETIKGRKKEKK